jgi:exodeoxyribonuclease VII large subunit
MLRGSVGERRWQLAEQIQALRHLSPVTQLGQARQRVDELLARAEAVLQHNLILRRERLTGMAGRLGGVSPMGTLERGYAIVRHRGKKGAVVRSTAQVAPEDELGVRVTDGEFGVKVA